MSHTADSVQFGAAADFTAAEVAEYRRIASVRPSLSTTTLNTLLTVPSSMFPPALGDPANVSFFTVEVITARGYALYQEYDPAERLKPLRSRFHATLRQLRAYREQLSRSLGQPEHTSTFKHPFFHLDCARDWITPGPLNTWMRLTEAQEQRGRSLSRDTHTPASSIGASPPRSRANWSSGMVSPSRSRSASSWYYRTSDSSRAASPSATLAFDLDLPAPNQPTYLLLLEGPPMRGGRSKKRA
ncbi:hypothetical protein C8F01DRAFT_1239119 [Mycena amicta]|nr:hypothetical protein C8F01DRAFT_1239119 [Mycena amicta]